MVSIINHPFWGTPIFGNIRLDALLTFLQERGQWVMAYVDTNHGASINDVESEKLSDEGCNLGCSWLNLWVKILDQWIFQVPVKGGR